MAVVALLVDNILLDDDSDDDLQNERYNEYRLAVNSERARSNVPKIENYMTVYAEMGLQQHIDDFKVHYRINRDTFGRVLEEILPELLHSNRGGSTPVTPEKQFLVFLNYLGNQQSMRNCAHFFGLSKSTVHGIMLTVIKALLKLRSRVIRWPLPTRQIEIAAHVEDVCGISGVVGFIDGTHIRLSHSLAGDNDYINRKGYPSMQLQAVVDDNLLFTSAYTGWPGCTHDARVLRNSQLYHKAEAGELFLPDHHLLADNAYPLRNWLISPFKNYGNLTHRQIKFNKKLSSVRQTVERAFGHLKARFRRLREVPLHKPSDICKLIISGCILHNLCIIESDDIDDEVGNVLEELQLEQDANHRDNVFQHGAHGVAKRLRLMQMMS